ncbi:hypothetical protein A8L45_11760 [Veronia pacifica]|uniref:Uncharacterized protein n=2 Tax=Veronia pacifica TaxID=1080227 RepID=A0A1C3EIN5_9GAMM|nr:hypothetical protein A8L45_11760 [Veronia pacifica]
MRFIYQTTIALLLATPSAVTLSDDFMKDALSGDRMVTVLDVHCESGEGKVMAAVIQFIGEEKYYDEKGEAYDSFEEAREAACELAENIKIY